jgi:hypothetical protein
MMTTLENSFSQLEQAMIGLISIEKFAQIKYANYTVGTQTHFLVENQKCLILGLFEVVIAIFYSSNVGVL